MSTIRNPREHGGNLDAAVLRFGGAADDWVDLSTGINPVAYPVPALPASAWTNLPGQSRMKRLENAARLAFDTTADIVPFAGAQGAIQAVPHVLPRGQARILAPTYNEHAGALLAAGWDVVDVTKVDDLFGADLAVVVNPNNPDGRSSAPEILFDLAANVGHLVVDESFVDCQPKLSLCPGLTRRADNITVLRSFGKFYGLAGIRLGFAVTTEHLAQRFRDISGPWPVSGPAIEVAVAAFEDADWVKQTQKRLSVDAARLDSLATNAGWDLIGGTPLFRTYSVDSAEQAQTELAQNHVWTRVFSYSRNWIRLGLPDRTDWQKLERAFAALTTD